MDNTHCPQLWNLEGLPRVSEDCVHRLISQVLALITLDVPSLVRSFFQRLT